LLEKVRVVCSFVLGEISKSELLLGIRRLIEIVNGSFFDVCLSFVQSFFEVLLDRIEIILFSLGFGELKGLSIDGSKCH
jgi:hypothetical protein